MNIVKCWSVTKKTDHSDLCPNGICEVHPLESMAGMRVDDIISSPPNAERDYYVEEVIVIQGANLEDIKTRLNCAFLDEACVDCEEDCTSSGTK